MTEERWRVRVLFAALSVTFGGGFLVGFVSGVLLGAGL